MYKAIERLRELLMERGIKYKAPYISDDTYWNANGIRWHAFESGGNTIWITCNSDVTFTPEQVIAMTVGDKHKDNPRNYKPNGEPKIPNMSVGADPDWVDWVASLEHKEPSNIIEAVQQLMFEVICFGGDMGPNDCGGENCPDEGMVYTEGFICSWAKKISAMIRRSCAACPEMDNPDSYIFHLMMALEHERGCCRDCKHSHMTADGKHCKWCSVLATHDIEGKGYCDPPNGYNPEPYFDAGFHCGFFERSAKVVDG